MANASKKLQSLCADPPRDLVDYFDTFPIEKHSDPRLGLLPVDDAVAMSAEFRTFHPLAQGLGLIHLDDANTSNHHCYITRGPLTGSILYLSHDDASRFVFNTLEQYLIAAKSAFDAAECLDDLHHDDERPKTPVRATDQDALAECIRELLQDESDENSVAQLIVYIPAMDLSNGALLESLARHSDVYVVEALGDAIWKSPRPELLPIATRISEHQYAQVADAGNRAMEAIKRITR
jgi:hypothetical protein